MDEVVGQCMNSAGAYQVAAANRMRREQHLAFGILWKLLQETLDLEDYGAQRRLKSWPPILIADLTAALLPSYFSNSAIVT